MAILLSAVILITLWIANDGSEEAVPSAAIPALTPTGGAMVVPKPMELPAPVPTTEPRELSALPIDGDRPADGSTSATPWVFELRHASGAAASGLRVAFQRVGRTVHVGESDADGMVTFMDANLSAGAPTGLWIGGVSGLILGVRTPESATDGVFAVDLPAGNEIVGTVTVDGFVPSRPVDLALTRFSSKWYELPPDEAVRQRLARADSRMAQDYDAANAQRATADGRFHFSGLGDDWQGRLRFPHDLYLDPDVHTREPSPGSARESNLDGMEGLSSLDLQFDGTQPTTQLQLALRTRPLLRGRAVWPDGSAAVGVSVSYELLGDPFPRAIRCDPTAQDGRFAIPCTWKAIWTPRLTLLAADGTGLTTLEVPEAHRTNSVDLGDVELQLTRAVVFRALDTAGDPIAGALATPDDGSNMRSAKTDAKGLSVIGLALDRPQFTLHALEYESAEVFVPEEVPEVLDVILEACCVLRLRLADDAGTDASGLLWRVSAQSEIFSRGQDIRPDPIRHELGMASPQTATFQTMGVSAQHGPGGQEHGSGTTTSGSVSFAVGPEELVLSCLRPSVLIEVALTDRTGDRVLWEQEPLSLAPGEDRLVVARVEARVRRFMGRVTDPQGNPVKGVRVYVGPSGGVAPSLGADTDADGLFAVDNLLCEAVDFDCAKTGYLTVVQSNVPIPSSGRVQITLRPSRVVEVEISSTAPLERNATLSVMVQGAEVSTSGLRHTIVGGVPTRPHGYSATVEALAGQEATLRLVNGDRIDERISPAAEGVVIWEILENG